MESSHPSSVPEEESSWSWSSYLRIPTHSKPQEETGDTFTIYYTDPITLEPADGYMSWISVTPTASNPDGAPSSISTVGIIDPSYFEECKAIEPESWTGGDPGVTAIKQPLCFVEKSQTHQNVMSNNQSIAFPTDKVSSMMVFMITPLSSNVTTPTILVVDTTTASLALNQAAVLIAVGTLTGVYCLLTYRKALSIWADPPRIVKKVTINAGTFLAVALVSGVVLIALSFYTPKEAELAAITQALLGAFDTLIMATILKVLRKSFAVEKRLLRPLYWLMKNMDREVVNIFSIAVPAQLARWALSKVNSPTQYFILIITDWVTKFLMVVFIFSMAGKADSLFKDSPAQRVINVRKSLKRLKVYIFIIGVLYIIALALDILYGVTYGEVQVVNINSLKYALHTNIILRECFIILRLIIQYTQTPILTVMVRFCLAPLSTELHNWQKQRTVPEDGYFPPFTILNGTNYLGVAQG